MKKTTILKKQLAYLAGSLFFLLISVAAFSQQAPVGSKYPKTLLWRISGNGLAKSSYLYGTIHLADKRLFYFGDSLYNAIEQTDGFAIEIDPDEMSSQMISSFGKEDESGYLKDAVDAEVYDRVKKKLEKKYGVKGDKITRRQAYLAKNDWLRDMQKPDDMHTVMDAWLYSIARNKGKWTGGIEDLEDQLKMIEREEQTFAFEDLLIDKRIIQGGLNKMIDIYLEQDLQAIEEFLSGNDNAETDEWMYRRNIKMAHRMDSLLKYRSSFFAVGAAHLPGDSGVIKLLREKGFKVEPVFSSRKISPDEQPVTVSELKWHPFVPSDSLYSVSFPSKSATMFMSENVIKMEMCIDIPTATYYMTMAIPNMRQEANKEKLIEEILQGFTKGSKIIERKKINVDGQIGLEFIFEKDGFQRVKCFIKGNYAFMSLMGHETKKEMITGAMADKYFSSFKVGEKALLASSQMRTYTNADDGFSVLMPQIPSDVKVNAEIEGWITKTYSSFDLKGTVIYMVVVRSTSSGYYLNGDSNYFALQKESWSPLLKELRKEEYFKRGEFPAMRYDFVIEQNKQKSLSQTLTINKGNRSYLLLAITNINGDDDEAAKTFFNSFQLHDYKRREWKSYTSPDGALSAYTPAPIIVKSKKDDQQDDQTVAYVSYDSTTAVSYEYLKIFFADYYHGKTDSAIFHDALNTQITSTDSVISRKYLTNGRDKAQEVVVQLKDNQNFRRMRLILHGDTIYMASAFLHAGLLNDKDVNRQFNDFVVLTPSAQTTLYQKRTKELLTDLASGDSTRFNAAIERIENIEFESDDLPMLKEALLKQYELAEEDHEDIYTIIADIIANLGDSSIISFIEKGYFSPKVDNEEQKLAMLRILASTKTKESFALLKNLLLNEPPQVDYVGAFEYKLRDSIQLVRSLFPELMTLGADSLYYDFTASMANLMLDSNLIDPSMLVPFEENLLKITEQGMKKLQNDSEADLWKEMESLHLLARLNTAKGNTLLQKLVMMNQKSVNIRVIPELLKNKQTVSKESMEILAADKGFRFGLYHRLQKEGVSGYFPVKFSSQKSLAESDVYVMAADEYTVEEIVYLESRVIKYKNEEKRFHLFKVNVGEDGWYLGISGAYNKDIKILPIIEDVGGIYWDEEYDSKRITQQFEAYVNEYLN